MATYQHSYTRREDQSLVVIKTFLAIGDTGHSEGAINAACRSYADRNRSDGFAFWRAKSAFLNGHATLSDIGKDSLY